MFIVFLLALLLGLCSCEQNNLSPTFQDLPVVEGYLKEGESISFKISRQVATDVSANYSPDNLSALNPELTEDDTAIRLTAKGGGVYEASQLVQAGKAYKLSFRYNQKLVTANTTIPTKPENYKQSVASIKAFTFGGGAGGGIPDFPDPVKLTWDNPNNSYYVVVIENTEATPEAINTGNSSPPARIFRNQPTQGNSYEIRVMQFNYYGKHNLKLYHINPDYAVLYSSGGSTSQNLFSPATNINNGVGIFTGMAGKVLELSVTK